MLIKCPRCGKEISDKSQRCVSCGQPIKAKMYTCKECGGRSIINFSVCPNCGCKKSFREKNTKLFYMLCGMVLAVAVIILFLAYRVIVFDSYCLQSSSMENTFHAGERLDYNTWAYKFSDVQRFDVIVFKMPDDESKEYVKRVIGLPGEKIILKDGKVYVNNSTTPLNEPYLKEAPNGLGDGTYEVPENCYFVLGDNRNNSKDSRLWENKYVGFPKILGKVKE